MAIGNNNAHSKKLCPGNLNKVTAAAVMVPNKLTPMATPMHNHKLVLM